LSAARVDAQAGPCRLTIHAEGPDSSAVVGAEVTASNVVARTDSTGTAELTGLASGSHAFLLRRIGFQPYRGIAVAGCAGQPMPVQLRLTPRPTTLASVTVRDNDRPKFTGPMAAFWERRSKGNGTFFTAVEIDQRNVQRVKDLILSVPGWGRSQQSGRFAEALSRGTAVRAGVATREPMRTPGQSCYPTVVIDGMASSVGELNVDGIDPRTLSGVEVYIDGSRTPSEFWGTAGQGRCGVVALWSRSADNMKHTPMSMQDALVDTIYDAHDVDTAAELDDVVSNQLVYPQSMRRSKASGEATVSLVVLPTGEPFIKSLRLVRASHPEFGVALMQSATLLRFVPARRGGTAVAQRTELTVRFDHSSRKP
jgi:hypothetical protein